VSAEDRRFVLILGTHRTGTKTLAAFFDGFPGVTGVHQDNRGRWVNVASNMRLEGRLSPRLFKWVVNRYLLERLDRQTAPVYVEANGFNYLAAQLVQERWPGTRIVHVVRDPRDFVASWLNWTTTRLKSRIAHTLIPHWHVNGARCGDVDASTWREWDAFTRACWYWRFKNALLARTYGNDPQSYYRCRLEDLIGAQHRRVHVQQLLEFTGVPYTDGCERFFDTAQNMSQRETLRTWEQWTPHQCATLARLCEPLMAEYGYGGEPEWLARIGGNAIEAQT